MNLERLRKLNPALDIRSVNDPDFSRYGRVVTGIDFDPLIQLVKDRPVPTTTNTYEPDLPEAHRLPIAAQLAALYGEMPVQIGFGGGVCLTLNALEWHQGNEVAVAVSEFVIMVASLSDVVDGRLDSATVRTFHLSQGQAVELYGTTLHYSPCNVDAQPFRMLVVLPQGTNEPLSPPPARGGLLAARNKWLIAHAEARKEIEEGAFVGIVGDNPRLRVQ